MKDNPTKHEKEWSECGMTAENIVKLNIGSTGTVEEILINMDSNLIKKMINSKTGNVSVERVRNKYIANIYSHALMIYTTMHGYYSRKDIEMDEYVVREVQDKLNEAVEFSFRYYGNFLMTFEDISD